MKTDLLPAFVRRRSARGLFLYTLLVLLLALLGALTFLLVVLESPARTFVWNSGAPAPSARSESQGAIANGKFYVFGGYKEGERAMTRSDMYDPSTDAWSRIADMPEALTHSPAVVDGETIYLIGGFLGDHPGPSTDHVWKYDTATDTWSVGPSLPESRGAGAAALLGKELHFYGGSVRSAGTNQYVDFSDHWVLSLDSETSWTSRADMPNPRNHLAGAALDGKIYAVGGQHEGDERSTNQSEVDAYDPTTDRWERVADLPEPRGHIASFVLDNCIVAVGGSVDGGDNGLATAEVTAYDPDMNVWVELPPLPEGRKTPVADAVGDRMIVTTGSGTDTTWVGVLANSRETGNLTAPCSEVAPRRTVGA